MDTLVIVNGHASALPFIESVLDTGRYHTVFVESSAQAYSKIRRIRPSLVILFLALDDADGFRALSMLKMDAATRGIPVFTSTPATSPDDEADEGPMDWKSVGEFFGDVPAARLN
jgi:DNA-binding response OmpR family regulator